MTKRFLDYDPVSGITTSVDYDAPTDTTYIISEFDDLSPTLDACKKLANDTEYTRKGIKDGWWHYAFIPNIIIHKWKIEEGIDVFDKNDARKVHQKLNSPEYQYLRTSHKKHFSTR